MKTHTNQNQNLDLKDPPYVRLIYEMVRLIETASAPIFNVDGDGNISGWNDKMGELTGLPLLEVVGVPLVATGILVAGTIGVAQLDLFFFVCGIKYEW